MTDNRTDAEGWAKVRAAERGGDPVVLEAPADQLPLRTGDPENGIYTDPGETYIDPADYGQVGPGVFKPVKPAGG